MMNFNRFTVAIFTLLAVLLPLRTLFGGGPLILFDLGDPYRYDTASPVIYNLDLGALGPLTNAQADVLANGSFANWGAVPTAAISFSQGADLAVDVVLANANTYLGSPGVGDGLSPVVYDTDGSIIANYFGAPPGVLGISSPTTALIGTHTITESYSIFNGAAIDPDDLGNTPPGAMFQGVFTHEHGHFINLAHTVVNGQALFFGDALLPDSTDLFAAGLGVQHTETMYPFTDVNVPGGTGEFQAVPDPDDAAILSTIYPEPTFFSTTGTITGTIFSFDGVNGRTGVQVIARNSADLLGDAVSAISGDFTQGFGPLGVNDGAFTLNGLTPGATYLLYIIDAMHGGFSTPVFVAPGGSASPSLGLLPGPEEFYNGANESADPLGDDPAESAGITVSAGSPVTANIIMNSAVVPIPADVLIWKPNDVPPGSDLAIVNALEAAGKTWSQTSDITLANIADYQYLFALLGMYPDNHVISAGSAEALFIESFLAAGGSVYLEGGDVWFWDPLFNGGHNFAPDFGIRALADGSADLSQIFSEACLAGMNFNYSGAENHVDRLDTTNNSYVFHRNTAPGYKTGIGFDFNGGQYRTVGNSFLFDGLDDFSISFFSKNDLMAAYLDFFDNGCAQVSPGCVPPLVTPTDAEGGTNDVVAVNIEIEQNASAIDAFGLKLIFNPAMLAYDSISAGDLTNGFEFVGANLLAPGQLIIGGYGTTPIPVGSTGGLATVYFTVSCGGCADGDTSQLSIQDLVDDLAGMNQCAAKFTFIENKFDISGTVSYCQTGGAVENTEMALSGGSSAAQLTDTAGFYLFPALDGNLNYTVTPSKTGDVGPLSITCFDAALIARIAVGLDLADHCDSLSADVDEDGNIFTFDAALTCRYAVGLPPFSPDDHTGEWRFEPAFRSYEPLLSNKQNEDYLATLLGDLDGSWAPAAAILARAGGTGSRVALRVEKPRQLAGRTEVLTLLDFDGSLPAFSFDMELNYPSQQLKFVKADCPLQGWTVMANDAEKGRLRLGMYAAQPFAESGAFLVLTWEITPEGADVLPISVDRLLVNRESQAPLKASLNLSAEVPRELELYQNYPNPFNPETVIKFGLPAAGRVSVKIYNLTGQEIKTLFEGDKDAGYHQLLWDATDQRGNPVSSGVYFYRIQTGEFFKTRKLMVLR